MKPYHTPNDQRCETCWYWDDYGDEEDAKPRCGACCRYPPNRNLIVEDDDTTMYKLWAYPVTGGHWWCGEWKNAKNHHR